jgi:P27 family predicted phage terminase small subunit
MGRPRKPKKLKQAQGTYRKDRDLELDTVEAPAGAPPCPPSLSSEAKKVWNEVVPELLAVGTLSKVDGGVLESYCRAFAQARKLDEKSNGTPVVNTPFGPKVHPAIAVLTKLLPVVEKLAFSLGLHYAARSKVKLPPKPKEKDAAEEDFFGKYERLARERHERDLALAAQPGGHPKGFYFDQDAADRVVRFVERYCKHYEGSGPASRSACRSGRRRTSSTRSLGGRRRTATGGSAPPTSSSPARTARASKTSALGLYLLIADGEAGRAGLLQARRRKSRRRSSGAARRRWPTPARTSAGSSRSTLKKKKTGGTIFCERTNSFFRPLGADSKTLDGLNPHAQVPTRCTPTRTRRLERARHRRWARGASRSPRDHHGGTYDPTRSGGSSTTTRVKVLEGIIEDDSFFAFICAIDEGDDPFDPENWGKANPNLGISIKIDYIEQQAEKAKRQPSFYNDFLRLHLNRLDAAGQPWLSVEKWNECDPISPRRRSSSARSEEKRCGKDCFAGLDLSSKLDLTALVLVFPADDGFYDLSAASGCRRRGSKRREARAAALRAMGPRGLAQDHARRGDRLRLHPGRDPTSSGSSTRSSRSPTTRTTRRRSPPSSASRTASRWWSISRASSRCPSRRRLSRRRSSTRRSATEGTRSSAGCVANAVKKTDSAGNIKPDKAKAKDKIDGSSPRSWPRPREARRRRQRQVLPRDGASPDRMKATPHNMRAIAPDLLGLIGLALLAYGAWRAWPPAGFMVGGVGLIVLASWPASRNAERRRSGRMSFLGRALARMETKARRLAMIFAGALRWPDRQVRRGRQRRFRAARDHRSRVHPGDSEGIAQLPLKLYKERRTAEASSPPSTRSTRSCGGGRTTGRRRSSGARRCMHAVLAKGGFSYVNRGRRAEREGAGDPADPARSRPGEADPAAKCSTMSALRTARRSRFRASEMMHLRGPSWNTYSGSRWSSRRARRWASPSPPRRASPASTRTGPAAVRHPLDGEDARPGRKDAIKKSFAEGYAGLQNDYKTIVLDNGFKFDRMSTSPADAQTRSRRMFQVEEICRVLRVFPQMVGYTDKDPTFASAESFFLAHVIHTLGPWIERFEQVISRDILLPEEVDAGYFAKFSVQGFSAETRRPGRSSSPPAS